MFESPLLSLPSPTTCQSIPKFHQSNISSPKPETETAPITTHGETEKRKGSLFDDPKIRRESLAALDNNATGE